MWGRGILQRSHYGHMSSFQIKSSIRSGRKHESGEHPMPAISKTWARTYRCLMYRDSRRRCCGSAKLLGGNPQPLQIRKEAMKCLTDRSQFHCLVSIDQSLRRGVILQRQEIGRRWRGGGGCVPHASRALGSVFFLSLFEMHVGFG
jgi:hypothetical protein